MGATKVQDNGQMKFKWGCIVIIWVTPFSSPHIPSVPQVTSFVASLHVGARAT